MWRSIKVSDATWLRVKMAAVERRVSMQTVVEEALGRGLWTEPKPATVAPARSPTLRAASAATPEATKLAVHLAKSAESAICPTCGHTAAVHCGGSQGNRCERCNCLWSPDAA